MFFYLIRHGNPDYKTDTLKPEGIEEAKLVAQRMKAGGLDCIYASSMGRARETASYTSELLGIPVTVCDWARELEEDCRTEFPDGERKPMMNFPRSYPTADEYSTLSSEAGFGAMPMYIGSSIKDRYAGICEGIDGILRENGYSRNERGFYDVTEYSEKHIALFAHNGMGRMVVSHLLNIPYRLTCNSLLMHYTGVTVFYFDDGHRSLLPTEEYEAAHPEYAADFEILNSTKRHIESTGLPETLPYLVSYGDIGHLFADGREPLFFKTKTKF